MAKRSPRTAGGPAKRVPISTKVLPALKDRLEDAAARQGRTLGNEIERRLESSFKYREELMALFSDERTFQALSAVALAWLELENSINKPWYEERKSLIAAQSAAEAMLTDFRASDGSTAKAPITGEYLTDNEISQLRLLGLLVKEKTRRRIKRETLEPEILKAAEMIVGDFFDSSES